MESPLAQRMDRLWMSLLMMVASSSAFRRSLLPPNGSSIEADWSKRKMKHPGFLRLISALYMLAPRFRHLLLASFDFCGFDLLGRNVDLVASPVLHQHPAVFALHDGDPLATAKRHRLSLRGPSLHVRGDLFRLDHCGNGGSRALAERPVPQPPADPAQRDERDPDVEQLERSADPPSSARRTRRSRSPIWKPSQTTCSALQKAPCQHLSGPGHTS